MGAPPEDPLFSAAVLKLSFRLKGIEDQPGFRVVYHSTLKDLKVLDSQVEFYIAQNRARLEEHIRTAGSKAPK